MVTTRESFGHPAPPAPDMSTTRIRFRARRGGMRYGVPYPDVGEELDVPPEEAARLIASGVAERAPEPIEQAVMEPPEERATIPTPTVRKRRSPNDAR